MIKVVTVQEMIRIERLAIERGASAQEFMLQAGSKVAQAARELLREKGGKKVVLLIGRGNKGGDAYVAGIQLLQAGYIVRGVTFAASADCSELNQYFAQQFTGTIAQDLCFSEDDLIIDGLLGTGFHGVIESGTMADAITLANNAGKPILSIDIPSGLDGTTGMYFGSVIKATETVTLGFPKIGLFKHFGWNCTGRLRIEEFGLLPEIASCATAVALIPKIEELQLPAMVRSHHKYERGFVVGFGGSKEFKGAVKLSGTAALHGGAGIVKLFTLEDVGPMADELITQIWSPAAWQTSLAKASAVFIGPGLGRSSIAKEWCKAALHNVDKPCVLDADALYFLPEMNVPKQCILTPHRGEMLHLLGEANSPYANCSPLGTRESSLGCTIVSGSILNNMDPLTIVQPRGFDACPEGYNLRKVSQADLEEEVLWVRCQEYVDKHSVVLILKGAPTHIFSPASSPIIIPRGDPGMATAGSGDVLTGLVAALLAQGQSLLEAAVVGVTLHALAGEAAALEKTSYGYSAGDLIEFFPSAFKCLITT